MSRKPISGTKNRGKASVKTFFSAWKMIQADAKEVNLGKSDEQRCEVMKYRVVLTKTDEGFSVHCPGLPGCWSQGATEEEALENIRDAIREYLVAQEEIVRGQDVRVVEVAV
jgi:predicted RNase H-like HicB family nuclease